MLSLALSLILVDDDVVYNIAIDIVLAGNEPSLQIECSSHLQMHSGKSTQPGNG